MRKVHLCLLLLIGAFGCKDIQKDYQPGRYLTREQQRHFLSGAAEFLKRPPLAPYAENTNLMIIHHKMFQHLGNQIRLEQYYKGEHNSYFLISIPAGLRNQRYAVAGRSTIGEKGEITSFEEIFRTWKMSPDVLQFRSYLLFDKMVNGEPLSPFYSNKMGDQFIEFPDDRTFYDKQSQVWKIKERSAAWRDRKPDQFLFSIADR
jgi:hypothetical protein